MTISVIIPNYNHSIYLPEVIASIINQKRPPDEVLIIDDASTDNSVTVIKSIIDGKSNFKLLVNQKNIGVHESVNLGVRLAKGEYLALCAADDLLMPDFFSSALKMFELHPSIGICCGDYSTFNDEKPYVFTEYSALGSSVPVVLEPVRILKLFQRGFVVGSNVSLYRKDLLMKYGCYKRDMMALADFFLIAEISLNHPICYFPKTFGSYRYVKNSYGDRVRKDFKKRLELYGNFLNRVENHSDPDFKSRIIRSGLLSFGGYFMVLFLIINPKYWRYLPKVIFYVLVRKFSPLTRRK